MYTKGENTRKVICEKAAILFSERGYKDVSMQDICNATVLSKGGLYRYFENKSTILLEIIKKEKTVNEDISEGKSAVQVLENLLQTYKNDMKNCRNSLSYALYEYAASTDTSFLSSGNEADLEYWKELVSYGVNTKEFNDVDPVIVMNTFLYAYRGIEMWGRVLDFNEKTYESILEAIRLLLIKGYKIHTSELMKGK